MKRIIYLLLLFPFICFGQVPQSMSYQAMATNSEGFEIANSQISVKVSIIEETPSGLVSFVEDHTVTTDAYGMFSINIGQGNTEDDYTAVDWSKSNFLKVELDHNMDGAYSLMGVSAFNSVPYSYMAENVMNPDELKDNLGDHTATQTLDMDSNYVSQVLAPELPLDAANKQYVDDMIGDITTGAGEIVHYYIPPESNIEILENCYYDNCAIIRVVPQNKILIFTNKVNRRAPTNLNPTNFNIDRIYVLKSILNASFSPTSNFDNQEDILIAFPGDTVFIDYTSSQIYYGFYYQYTVSATQIDDNTTSYSMVSLDEGESSSGGTITEGAGGSSSQGSYLMSQVSQESMNISDAMSYCRNLEEGGYTDWYLPTIEEVLDAMSGKIDSVQTFDNNQIWTKSYEESYTTYGYVYMTIRLNDFYREYGNGMYYAENHTICLRKN